ncbi:MAG TPA: hypothetical protein VGE57_01890 [Solimonas sp.]
MSPRELPEHALLQRHRDIGAYTDCYAIDVPGTVSLADYVTAFYTTPLFKIERLILRLALGRRSADAQARALATGSGSRFAAWDVEARADDQLLVCEPFGKTCSWFMVETLDAGAPATRLYFGSAVATRRNPRTGSYQMAPHFRPLNGLHRRYSVALLRAAARRLRTSQPS